MKAKPDPPSAEPSDAVTSPTALGLLPRCGFGDRIGLATAGPAVAARRFGAGIAPIFAQQSIREMTHTGAVPPR
ncbi:MAG: tagaturonate epimerase family protein [Verrucomicrobia bacterium]|nr:tagaturonate epimerase family protein [Verrucomicrobiota bacterium]